VDWGVVIFKLTVSKSKNAASFYVQKSVYYSETGVHSSKTIEKLGTEAELRATYPDQDPYEWAREYVAELNRLEKEKENQERDVLIKYSPVKQIPKGEQRSFNGGYLVLARIYHSLGLDKISKQIQKRYKFTYDLDCILSRLVYSRIIYPASKLATLRLSKRFIEPPNFDLQHIYRSLDVLEAESDFIQAELYKRSLSGLSSRNTGVLYYDCTNFFFEAQQADGLKQYSANGKDHKPNPLVQMGLFLDGDGIPLAFSITPGNRNEQITLRPLEQQILSDFGLAKFIVCTDAGLSSDANKRFNDMGERAFVTTQSVKKLDKLLKGWVLFSDGWKLAGSQEVYDISNLYKKEDEQGYLDQEEYLDKIFYKERWVDTDGLSQRLIVTFSVKYRRYHRKIRAGHIARAYKLIQSRPARLKKSHSNDYRRFVQRKSFTSEGEEAKKTIFSIDQDLIAKEEIYDGFYAVYTNLEDDVETIIKINRRRWEIEESFRIMKQEFKARPAFLQKDVRIIAHFLTCFISLLLFRYLEKLLGEKYTCCEIVDTLRQMNFLQAKGDGYIPTYTRTDLTDDLHTVLGERTDFEIVTTKQMKTVLKASKKK